MSEDRTGDRRTVRSPEDSLLHPSSPGESNRDEQKQDRPGALKVLNDFLLKIRRRDLAHRVRKAVEKYQSADPQP
jgi:hypothetical protein